MSQAKVLAIANQKGGVGKTTTALTLAEALGRRGKRVLVLDLDPHCCASVHLRFYPDEERKTAYDLFAQENCDFQTLWPEIVNRPEELSFDFCPACVSLSDLEIDLKGRKGKGAILASALEPVREQYDFILLDCPPHLGLLLVNALVASDLLIVPIQTDFLALHGFKLLIDTVKMLNKTLPEPLDYRALPTMFDKRAKACGRVLDLLHNKMGERVFVSVIGMDTKFREASAFGTVIYKVDQASRGAKSYDQLAEEILALW